MQQIKKLMQRGLLDPEQEDPFSLFVASTNIRYCYYSETHKILGNTFGMCVLQVGTPLPPQLLGRRALLRPRTSAVEDIVCKLFV
jgi:N-acetyltransferase 10